MWCFKIYTGSIAEIKRMYVTPAGRGKDRYSFSSPAKWAVEHHLQVVSLKLVKGILKRSRSI
jgi:hypothetical protein